MVFAANGHTSNKLDIKKILEKNSVAAHFQQVVYITRKSVCGLEGLIRGTDGESMISPCALFEAARQENLVLELDRLCREKVLEAFSFIYGPHKDKILFLNVDASILDRVAGSGYLIEQVKRHGINPGNIVLEINEAKVQENDALKAFIDIYRSAGFLIALDDVGAGFSNLDRIPIVKPDIIKVDMGLVRDIDCDYHKQEVFKSLIRLSTQIGAMVVAEGVETESEAVETLRLGANMIQGFYLSRPCLLGSSDPFGNCAIDGLAARFKQYMHESISNERQTHRQIAAIVKDALMQMPDAPEFSSKLKQIVSRYDAVECAYVLDEHGKQCSDTVFGNGEHDTRNLIFYSAQSGTDHSMKRYYYQLAKRKRYMTEPYVSLATGSLCVTFSEAFYDQQNKKFILCMDFYEKSK